MELPDIDEENAALARTAGAQRQDDLPDIDVENARLQETDLPDIEEENARVQETDLPDIDVENGILAQKSQTTQTPAVQTTQPTATVEQQPTPAEQQPDTHWQEMDERARQFNLGDAIYAAGEHVVEGLKGARDVIGSVANPVLKLVGDAAQGLGNLSAHGVVMPNGIAIGERGELGGNKLTPDELAAKRRNNIGTAVGSAINEGVDTIFPNEPNDNPVTAKIQKVGNEIGGLLRFTIGSAAALGAAEYGPTWNADYDAYIKAGKTPAEAAAWADLGGITNAIFAMALKGIPVGHYVKKMFGWELPENLLKEAIDKAGTLGMKEVKAAMTKILAGKLFKNAVTEAGVLGGVSAAQTAATGAIQQLGTTGEIDAEALGEAALESGLHGAATGAIMGALPIAVKIPEARKGAEEPIRTAQEMRAAANASRFTPEQKTALNMRVPEFVGDDAEMTGRVMDRISEKMADEAINGTPEGKTPLRERLDDPAEMEIEIQKATEELLFEDNAAEIAKNVNTKSLGTKAADRATEIATTMPRTADKTESRIAGEIGAADPDMPPERVWEVAEYLAAHGGGAGQDGQPLTKERIAEVEKAMVADKAGVVPVEQPDGTFKTVNEVEAEAAREERKTPYSAGWSAYQKAKIEFDARQKRLYESGVTPEELQQVPELVALNKAQHEAYEKFKNDPNEETAAEVKEAMDATMEAAEKYAEVKVRGNLIEAVDGIAGENGYGILRRGDSEIRFELGKSGKKGMGAMHIVESRMRKDGLTLDEAAEIAVKVGQAAVLGQETLRRYNTIHYDYNGVRAIVAVMPDGSKVITGYEINADADSGANRRPKPLHASPHVSSEEVVAALKRAAQRLGEKPENQGSSTDGIIANQDGNVNGGAKPVDHSADWTPVSGKTGVFHTAEFPEVEIALQDAQPGEGTKPDGTPKKIMFIENLPDPATLDEAGQLKLGEYLSKRLKEATKLKVEEVNIGTPEQAAEYQKLVDKYEQKVTGDKFQVRADSVVGLLKKSGLASDVIATEEEFNAKLASYGKDGQRLIADGRTYGFTDGTNVYLNPAFFRTRIGLNTPIHEFGHLAIIATKNVNRAVYDRALTLIKDTGYWKAVSEHPDYASLPDWKKAEEALTRLIAERGERLEATTPKGVIAEIKKLLVEIWKSFGNALGIRDLTPEKIEKMTVEDIADAIRAEMSSGREFGTRELSVQEGDLKAKILRFAKYSKPTSKGAKAALEAAKKAWKELSEEQKVALGRYGDTSVLKTQEARTIANGVRMLREWDARRARISQAVKDQIRRSPNEGQKKIITGSPQYYVSQVTGDVTSPFAYAIDRGLPIPRKGDWGWDAWDRLTDGMKYPEKRQLMRILGGEHPKRGGMDTVLSDYAQWLGISWGEGARDFEHGRGIEDFLDDILKERAKFEQWKSGDRKTREEYEAERASTEDLAKVYDAIANGEPPMGLRPQNKKDAAIAMSKMAELSRDGKLPESVEAFDTGANQKTYVKFTYGDGSEFKIYGDAKSITAWAEKVGLRRTASVRQQESGMTDAEFAEEDAWVRTSEARRVEAERMGEQDDLSDMPDFSRGNGGKAVFNRPRAWAEGSSNGVPDSQSDASPLRLRRKSGGTAQIVPNDGNKVKARIQKFNNRDFRIDVGDDRPVGAIVKSMCKALGLRQKGSYNSHYGIFETPDGKVAFRLSGHTAEGENFRQNGTQRNTSVVIQMYDLQHGETTVPFEEFVYPKDVFNANREKVVAAIMNGVGKMIDTGRFEDSSGLATYTDHKGIMLSRGGLYTGSAADYEKPSLHYVGTGEGSQVYGWGLYGSTERGVAEGYARPNHLTPEGLASNTLHQYSNDRDAAIAHLQKYVDSGRLSFRALTKEEISRTKGAIEILKSHAEKSGHLYEQTFFTNRAPGDESHLLKWYEPVSERQFDWIIDAAQKHHLPFKELEPIFAGFMDGKKYTGQDVYHALAQYLGTPKAASEFLARADIDGIKYPVDSYGGKTVKDGDEVGWNYVSFRDDNIRVDHKWRDGEMLFSRGGGARLVGGRTRVAADQNHGERTPGGLAAARELADVRRAPVSTLGARRFLSLQISDLEELRKIVSEDVRPAHVAKTEAGVARTEGQVARGKVAIWSDTIGVVDHTDKAVEMANLKAHGFFRNEDPYWCMGRSDAAIKAEKSRSEQQLSRQLEALGEHRMRGMEPGGQTAERGVFADEVAKVVLAQERRVGGRLGRLQTIGKAVQDAVARMPGMNQADAEWSARRFLDWAYGQPDYSRNMSGKQLTAEMFGKWLVMPRAVEQTAPEWANAIEQTVAADPKLADAFRTLADRRLNGDEYLMRRIRRQMSRQTEEALAAIEHERNLPIGAGSNWDNLKEIFVLGFHDKMGSVSLRINASVREKIKAMKEALRAAPPNMRPQLQQQIDLYLGDIGEKLKRIRISRQALERGNINEGSIYFRKFIALENEATQRWGLQLEDIKLYMDQWRVIETSGRSGSFGEDVVQARKALDEMEARLGPEKWLQMQQFGNEFFAIHERELLNDERAVQMLGRPYIDYLLTQVHYVATKRVHSVEELDAIEVAKRDAIAAGVAGGDNVVDMMFDYGERNGFGKDLGEGGWTAKMTGSMAAKADVFGATLAKTASLQRAIWRNRLVIDIRDALLAAEVKGVRDLPRKEGQKFPDGMRYGHLNYMENGQKRTLVVPMQISSAFKRINIPMLNHLAKIPRFINSLWRSFLIDFNPAYWPMNIRRNQDSIEHNMPGMKENAVKTALRLAPGTGPIADLVSQAVVRNLPVSAKMLGKFENIMLPYVPQMERITKIIQDQNAWQREKWDAIDRNDLAKLQQLQDDWKMMEDMLRGNMFVSINGEYRGEPDMNAEADALAKKGLRTMIEEARLKSRPKSKKERLFDAVTLVFRANQRQQQKEDILAKGVAYLAERKRFGLVRKPNESALLVAERVSIAQGERKGYASDTMRLMVPFFNMIEKGVVRHVARYGIKGERKDVITQDAKFLFGSLTAGLLAKGLIQYWILDANDGDEEKALKSPYGPLYRYSKFYHDAYRNCSEYVRKNYQFVPLWTKGYTSIIMGGALTDEERILFPISDYTTDMLAAASGIAEKPSLGNAIMDASVRLVVPDLEITGPIVETLRIAHAAVTGANPEDSFRRAPMFDQRKIDMRYESWQDFAEFSSMIGAKLANYWGLRGVYKFDENGVDNGRGEVDEPVEWALKKLPIVSPVLGRMIKVQVGSPKKDAAPITAERKRRDTVISVCAERLFEKRKGDTFFHDRDWKGYTEQLAKFKETYGLDDDDVDLIRARYLNACNTYENRDALDKRALEKAMEEAERQGKSKAAIWVMLGER